MTSKTTPQRIVNRLTPCNCGCKGSDSWHRSEYKRCVTVTETMNPAVNEGPDLRRVVLAVGTAKMPYGVEDVELRAYSYDGKITSKTWTRAAL